VGIYLEKKLGSGFLITRFITYVASLFSSEKKADEIQEFFSTRMQPSIERTVNQTIGNSK
jgi:macrodomain Ter protein organizer (MatP/YcbG family)